MPSGKRFFLIQYRRLGRTRRVMLGQFGPITAERACREATHMLGNVRGANGDPATLRDQERQSTSVQELGERFLKEHVAVRCKPRTQGEYKRAVELFINPFFGAQRARSVTPADVADLHGAHSRIPYQANRTLGVLSKMMSLAETWGIRDKHTYLATLAPRLDGAGQSVPVGTEGATHPSTWTAAPLFVALADRRPTVNPARFGQPSNGPPAVSATRDPPAIPPQPEGLFVVPSRADLSASRPRALANPGAPPDGTNGQAGGSDRRIR